MIDPDTIEFIDKMVEAIFFKEPDELRRKLQQKAAHVYVQGTSGSPFAWAQHVLLYHEHYKEVSKAICEAILRVAQDAEAPVQSGMAQELKALFDGYMTAVVTRTDSKINELLKMMGDGPKRPTFDEVHFETRAHYHNEIDLWARKAMAEQRREQRMATNITYNNLNGANARMIINSTDYSINVANSQPIFQGIRETIQSGVEDEKLRGELLTKTAELEAAAKAKEKPKFLKVYAEWVALAANHMKLLGPWIPAITEFLTH